VYQGCSRQKLVCDLKGSGGDNTQDRFILHIERDDAHHIVTGIQCYHNNIITHYKPGNDDVDDIKLLWSHIAKVTNFIYILTTILARHTVFLFVESAVTFHHDYTAELSIMSFYILNFF